MTRRDFFMSKKIILDANNIKHSFGEEVVLDFERFSMYEGEKIGLVGVNGAGKTTLLKILSGEIKPEMGTVKKECDVFFFEQFEDENKDEKLIVHNWEVDGREASLMGIKEQLWQDTVSGGESTRIKLAKLFGSDKAVAFIDEPTANLDRKGIVLLTEKLREIDTFILISHDRELLNSVCNRIVEVSFGKLDDFNGNYDDYLAVKEERTKREWTEYEQYQAEKKRLNSVYYAKKEKARDIERKSSKLSSSEAKAIALISTRKIEDKAKSMENSAKNVLKRIEHMDKKEKPKEVQKIRPDFRLTNPPENRFVIRGENINFAYDEHIIFEDASFIIPNKSKVAIIGDNGAGKTTLLNMIKEQNGISVVPGAKIGYCTQNLSMLKESKTVLENIMEVSIQKDDIARMILARLLLTERDINKKVGDLSGGQKMKLAFAMLFVSNVNLLILDEPTNYMDIPSIEALEELFSEYEGTLIFVSHDARFVDRIATIKLEIKDKKIVSIM